VLFSDCRAAATAIVKTVKIPKMLGADIGELRNEPHISIAMSAMSNGRSASTESSEIDSGRKARDVTTKTVTVPGFNHLPLLNPGHHVIIQLRQAKRHLSNTLDSVASIHCLKDFEREGHSQKGVLCSFADFV
jgi:hypothetical protein